MRAVADVADAKVVHLQDGADMNVAEDADFWYLSYLTWMAHVFYFLCDRVKLWKTKSGILADVSKIERDRGVICVPWARDRDKTCICSGSVPEQSPNSKAPVISPVDQKRDGMGSCVSTLYR